MPLLLLLLALISPSLAIDINPRVGHAPLDVVVRLTIEPSDLNQAACFVYDGPKYSASCFPLYPDSLKTTRIEVKRLPAGQYIFGLSVLKLDGSIKTVTTDICVIGNEECS